MSAVLTWGQMFNWRGVDDGRELACKRVGLWQSRGMIDAAVSKYLEQIGRKGGQAVRGEAKSKAGKLGWTASARAKRALNGRKLKLIKASG